ncbi:hypothetical protein L3X38_031746 [Prunus dulcis]|uniref:Uncharacterized protein n=1 Tax=Prunus dulcis TaxID=3755 RepID=A0AAD4YVF3_PRUDU|nr:hypothetical protein L3X38_031746 [Prunus dulcis]
MEVGNLKGLRSLDLYDNMLSGELPRNLGKCESLEVPRLQGDSFQGTILLPFEILRGIQVLDLSRNNLLGKFPQYLEGLRLLNLNISFNDFEGMLPGGRVPFKNTSATLLLDNSKLCGSFGSVYKGVLDDGGALLVAIKVFNLLRQGASKSFIARSKALRNIRASNLVKIITACA